MNKKNQNIFQRRLNYEYPVIERGKGIYLYSKDNKKYIDAVGGAVVANLGHGIDEIAKAIYKAAKNITYLHGSQFTADYIGEYAKEICKIAPKGLNKVFFVSGGSEAVESALKLAMQYHYDSGNKKKYKIVYRKPGYHGSTILTLSLSSKPTSRKPFEPLVFDFPFIPAPFCYRCQFNEKYPGCKLKCADALEKAIKRENPNTISSFIAEPVIGASAGAVVPPNDYFKKIRKICDKHNIILVIDEVMTGMGRTGKWFASEHFNLKPDILVVSKGISGGFLPLAAVFCTDKIFNAIKNGSGNFYHGFTYENNSTTIAAGRAVLKYIKENKLIENSERMGQYLMEKLKNLIDIDIVGDVRGIGLMTAVEFVSDKKTKKPFSRDKQVAEKILKNAMDMGLNLYFSVGFIDGKEGDAVMVTPPLNVTKKEIDEIVAIFKKAILKVRQIIKN